MSYILLVPQINSASISPNPVNANTSFLIAISVSEIEEVLEPMIFFSGTFYAGQEVVL